MVGKVTRRNPSPGRKQVTGANEQPESKNEGDARAEVEADDGKAPDKTRAKLKTWRTVTWAVSICLLLALVVLAVSGIGVLTSSASYKQDGVSASLAPAFIPDLSALCRLTFTEAQDTLDKRTVHRIKTLRTVQAGK